MNLSPVVVALGVFALGQVGCAQLRTPEDRNAHQAATEIGNAYRPHGDKPVLPVLTAVSPPTDYFRFALLNHPQVEAAYYEWRSAVDAIAPAGALPDPQLTFQADIADTLMSLMPGLMFDLMAKGKRTAMMNEAAATSQVAYRQYTITIVKTVVGVRQAWVELGYIEEAISLRKQQLQAWEHSRDIANTDYATGRGMGTLEAQTKFLNEIGRVSSELVGLSDRRVTARARFKAALGILREDPDPAWPASALPATTLPNDDVLWQRILAANPDLAAMRAMVDMVTAQVEVAQRAGTPDFTAGLMVDLKANPLMFRPTATMSLPIWRSKIAAVISSTQAKRKAAEARLTAEQISMAAEFAQMLFMIHEADRMVAYLDQVALPNTARALSSVAAAYQSGMGAFAPLVELQLMQLSMQSERIDARLERENAIVNLSRMVADEAPTDGLLITSHSSR